MEQAQMSDSNAELQALRRENASLVNLTKALKKELQSAEEKLKAKDASVSAVTDEKCDVKNVVRIKSGSALVMVNEKKDPKLEMAEDTKIEPEDLTREHPVVRGATEVALNSRISPLHDGSGGVESHRANLLTANHSVDSDPPQTEPGTTLDDPNDFMSVRDVEEPDEQINNNHLRELPMRPKKLRKTLEVVLSASRRLQAAKKTSKVPPQKLAVSVKHDPDDEIVSALAVLQNPTHKVKVDKGRLLDGVSVYSRLQAIVLEIYPIHVEKEVMDFGVPRAFLSSQYGGNTQGVFAEPTASKRRQHGFDNFLYMTPDYHPNGPQRPGAPGLWFNPNDGCGFISRRLYRVIVRIKPAPKPSWLYLGQYKMCPSESLTPQEWVMQSDMTKRSWAGKMIQQPWGWYSCARVVLRVQKGREPTEKEIDELLRTPNFEKPSRGELIAAFDSGEEKLYAWALKCEGYDEVFQRDIVSKYPTWTPPPPRSNKKVEKEKSVPPKSLGKRKEKGKDTLTGERKRKRLDESESEEDPLGEEDESEDETGQALSLYRSRGTRSRPIVV